MLSILCHFHGLLFVSNAGYRYIAGAMRLAPHKTRIVVDFQ
jgi:hypothetical protein